LLEAGYEGDFDIELAGEDIEFSDYHHLLEISKIAFDDMLTPALHAE